MKQWKKILIENGDNPQEVAEENDYHISNGCCYFHDQKELDEFDDVDDDTPKGG
jgi:hypothetical protein